MGTLPSKEHVFPLVRGTIGTHVAAAFVVVAIAGRMRTRDIEENTTHDTFLLHGLLRVPDNTFFDQPLFSKSRARRAKPCLIKAPLNTQLHW